MLKIIKFRWSIVNEDLNARLIRLSALNAYVDPR